MTGRLLLATLFCVAPFTGAWIEIENQTGAKYKHESRSLHGSVD